MARLTRYKEQSLLYRAEVAVEAVRSHPAENLVAQTRMAVIRVERVSSTCLLSWQ